MTGRLGCLAVTSKASKTLWLIASELRSKLPTLHSLVNHQGKRKGGAESTESSGVLLPSTSAKLALLLLASAVPGLFVASFTALSTSAPLTLTGCSCDLRSRNETGPACWMTKHLGSKILHGTWVNKQIGVLTCLCAHEVTVGLDNPFEPLHYAGLDSRTRRQLQRSSKLVTNIT